MVDDQSLFISSLYFLSKYSNCRQFKLNKISWRFEVWSYFFSSSPFLSSKYLIFTVSLSTHFTISFSISISFYHFHVITLSFSISSHLIFCFQSHLIFCLNYNRYKLNESVGPENQIISGLCDVKGEIWDGWFWEKERLIIIFFLHF